MKNYIERSMSFTEYVSLLDRLTEEGKTTGPNQSELYAYFTKLNRQRMTRIEKTIELNDVVRRAARETTRPQTWLIITEAWCGDASQNIPIIEKIASESDNIETRYILRDENPELMDQYLTFGARSIPKLIALDAETLEVLGTWGARPAAAQKLYADLKEQGVAKTEIVEQLQRWYNEDRGRSIQNEFAELLSVWQKEKIARAKA